MKITVVIPCFNAVSSINRTLNSVKNQDYQDFECLVIDGGSTDGTLDVIHSQSNWITKIVSEKDEGQYHALKKGFSMARGELLCWLNADDIYFPWTFRVVNRIFTESDCIQWISGIKAFMRDDAIQATGIATPFPRELIQSGCFHPNSEFGSIMQECCFWTKKLYDDSGGLNCNWKMAADFDLWIRFSNHTDLFATSALLGAFNYTGKNRSHEDEGMAYSQEVETIRSFIPLKQRKVGDWLNEKKKFSKELFFRHPWLAILLGEYMRKSGLSGPLLQFCIPINRYKLKNAELII
jgi:glycosyltransferase involved in cell wall biosynthesis